MRRLASWRTAGVVLPVSAQQQSCTSTSYISISCYETNLCTWRKLWLFVWMIQIFITLQILANIIPEIFWTLILQALSAMIYINKKENQKTVVKDVLRFGTSQSEVALHFFQCVQDEKLLCGLPRRVEETKIFGWQVFCSIFVQSLVKGQEIWLAKALNSRLVWEYVLTSLEKCIMIIFFKQFPKLLQVVRSLKEMTGETVTWTGNSTELL